MHNFAPVNIWKFIELTEKIIYQKKMNCLLVN